MDPGKTVPHSPICGIKGLKLEGRQLAGPFTLVLCRIPFLPVPLGNQFYGFTNGSVKIGIYAKRWQDTAVMVRFHETHCPCNASHADLRLRMSSLGGAHPKACSMLQR